MTVSEMIIAAANERDSSVDAYRADSIRSLVEDTQREFDDRAERMAMKNQDLDRAYSL